jgi:hypothetical protein
MTLLAVTIVGIAFGPLAALVLVVALFAAGFVLTFFLRAIIGANLPVVLSHKTDELTLFFLYSAMMRGGSGSPQMLLQSGSDHAANMRFMRSLKELPSFRLVSDTVSLLGPVVCFPAFKALDWFVQA